jgi:hypothetical protein
VQPRGRFRVGGWWSSQPRSESQQWGKRDHNCPTAPARSLRQISAHLNVKVSLGVCGLLIWLLLCLSFYFFYFYMFLLLLFSLFYALVVFVNVCKQSGPRPPMEHSSTWGAEDVFVRFWTLSCVLVLQFVFYLAWSTYPAGMTDSKCGINQSIYVEIFLCVLSYCLYLLVWFLRFDMSAIMFEICLHSHTRWPALKEIV